MSTKKNIVRFVSHNKFDVLVEIIELLAESEHIKSGKFSAIVQWKLDHYFVKGYSVTREVSEQ